MKLVCKQAVLAAVFLLPLSAPVHAYDEECPVTPVLVGDTLTCPATELPEPSSAWLFVAAAGVGAVVRKIRNNKKK